ncbi:glycoside hydrolase family 19 protein [Cupriavidus pinatubonensis]|uniref:glycoside hydrolase family 19 protein n=1 Tax=Cupriavidus pinatubonensis TaxID=248026 RepID=UPI001C72CFF7|nr:glycoside hydrolase family 19 protein [Cupriavidus pinatubonensis]QYY30294.1 glycoside hydrolase family 19 protein [Cupriavidus pinatubonensis]
MDKQTFQKAADISVELADRWYPPVSAALFEFGILAPHRVAAWIGQVGHESKGFTTLVESFDYSVEALVPQFGKRITPAIAAQLGRQPGERMVPLERQARIAAIVYASRYGNGEAASGDGWRYRGRSLKQVTFRANYEACGHALGVDLIAQPDLLATDDTLAARAAAWFWYANGCNQLADLGDIEQLTRRINGGLNGLVDRRRRWGIAKQYLNV